MPTPPPIPGVRFRAFAGPSDFPAMVACANGSFAEDKTGFFRTVEDTARDYAAFTSCMPERDVWIAEAGSEIAGYVRAWHWAQADGLQLYGQLGVVVPHWRRRGVGTALHVWLEARQREMAADHPRARGHQHHAFVTEGETARMALLEKAGYHRERYFLTMVRPTLDALPDYPLPPGLELRPRNPSTTAPSGTPLSTRSAATGATRRPTKRTTGSGWAARSSSRTCGKSPGTRRPAKSRARSAPTSTRRGTRATS